MSKRLALGAAVTISSLFPLLGGCGHEVQKLQLTRPNEYQSDYGKKITLDQTPPEVSDFITKSYPDARIDRVYEMTHSPHMRHFEVHLILPGDRKKQVDYNFFPKPTPTIRELPKDYPGTGVK